MFTIMAPGVITAVTASEVTGAASGVPAQASPGPGAQWTGPLWSLSPDPRVLTSWVTTQQCSNPRGQGRKWESPDTGLLCPHWHCHLMIITCSLHCRADSVDYVDDDLCMVTYDLETTVWHKEGDREDLNNIDMVSCLWSDLIETINNLTVKWNRIKIR